MDDGVVAGADKRASGRHVIIGVGIRIADVAGWHVAGVYPDMGPDAGYGLPGNMCT